jgi:hypothetical protein
MRTALLLAVVCLISCGSQAQAPVTTSETFMLTMHVLGNEISFSVEDEELDGSPEWLNPESDPPPFAIPEAVRISRAELNRYVAKPEEWQVSGIELRRFERRARWFYVVEWRPRKTGHVGDGVSIPILMNGRAVVGKVRPDPDAKRNN